MRVVQKFGGTSLKDKERILNVAKRIQESHRANHQLAVVVSAMGGETNRLATIYQDMALEDDECRDSLLASGEQISVSMLTAALRSLGVSSVGFFAWQLPIITDDCHGKARIISIDTTKIIDLWEKKSVAVIAGFQGITEHGRLTTLGRGGSDTSAVALAIALKADICEIYTDVEGVYHADPSIIPDARKHRSLTYEEMLEMASSGSKVLHPRASNLAMQHDMKLVVRSSFTKKEGTLITSEKDILEQANVSAVTHQRDVAKITLTKLDDRPGVAADIFQSLLKEHISVDMIVQNIAAGTQKTDITFTISRIDTKTTTKLLTEQKSTLGYDKIIADETVAQLSIVGVGMRDHVGIAAQMFQCLAEEGINIQLISTSEIKVSILIAEKSIEKAVRSLHKSFSL